jgi:hypothetical protein
MRIREFLSLEVLIAIGEELAAVEELGLADIEE